MAATCSHTQSRAPPAPCSPPTRHAGCSVEEDAHNSQGVDMHSKVGPFSWLLAAVALALLSQPTFAAAAANPLCPGEDVFFNPGNGEDIVVPPGSTASAFPSGLNFLTAAAFRGNTP